MANFMPISDYIYEQLVQIKLPNQSVSYMFDSLFPMLSVE